MTTDTITRQSDNAEVLETTAAGENKILTYIAIACSVAGLVFFWYPIAGIAHALAGTILGGMTFKSSRSRIARWAMIIGAVATVASMIMTIIELHSIDIVSTYSASPWI